jgi:hypothetical protein
VEFIVHTRLCGFGPSVEDGPEHERDQTRDGKVRELFGELDMATALRRWNGEPPALGSSGSPATPPKSRRSSRGRWDGSLNSRQIAGQSFGGAAARKATKGPVLAGLPRRGGTSLDDVGSQAVSNALLAER